MSYESLGIDFTICFEYVNDIFTALVDTLESSIKHAYGITEKITWKDKYFRIDIGKKGLTYL